MACCGGGEPAKDGLPLEEAVAAMGPLDLLFFRGKDAASALIRHLERRRGGGAAAPAGVGAGDYSHVGLVVPAALVPAPVQARMGLSLDPGAVYVWESTMSGGLSDGVPNARGESYFGVQLREVGELVRAYDRSARTRVAHAPLLRPPSAAQLRAFRGVFERHDGAPYDANPVSLLGGIFPRLRCCRGRVETLVGSEQWLFCSELVATAYRDVGIFPKTVAPADVVPMDLLGFDDESVSDANCPVVVGAPRVITAYPAGAPGGTTTSRTSDSTYASWSAS